jgi:hypothetical protein
VKKNDPEGVIHFFFHSKMTSSLSSLCIIVLAHTVRSTASSSMQIQDVVDAPLLPHPYNSKYDGTLTVLCHCFTCSLYLFVFASFFESCPRWWRFPSKPSIRPQPNDLRIQDRGQLHPAACISFTQGTLQLEYRIVFP